MGKGAKFFSITDNPTFINNIDSTDFILVTSTNLDTFYRLNIFEFLVTFTFTDVDFFLNLRKIMIKKPFFCIVQGDPKLAPPLPGQGKKCSMKTKDSIFKYILFKYYLESSGVLDQI